MQNCSSWSISLYLPLLTILFFGLEEITAPYNGDNPFSLGIMKNIKWFCVSPAEGSLVQPRSLVPLSIARAGRAGNAPPPDAQV